MSAVVSVHSVLVTCENGKGGQGEKDREEVHRDWVE